MSWRICKSNKVKSKLLHICVLSNCLKDKIKFKAPSHNVFMCGCQMHSCILHRKQGLNSGSANCKGFPETCFARVGCCSGHRQDVFRATCYSYYSNGMPQNKRNYATLIFNNEFGLHFFTIILFFWFKLSVLTKVPSSKTRTIVQLL